MGIFDGYLLLSDIDGTFLDENSQVHPKNLDAAKFFMDEGGFFSLATGRPFVSAIKHVKTIGPNSPSLFCNGGVIYDTNKNKVIHLESLSLSAKDVIKKIMKEFPDLGVEIVTPDKLYSIRENENAGIKYTKDEIGHFEKAKIDDVTDIWVKIILIDKNENLFEVEKFLKKNYPKFTYIRTFEIFLEIVPKGTSKGNSLLYLADNLGVPLDKTFAIGDFDNDITMIKIAEIGAFAGNAPGRIKHHADVIVADNKNGAVADFIGFLTKLIKK